MQSRVCTEIAVFQAGAAVSKEERSQRQQHVDVHFKLYKTCTHGMHVMQTGLTQIQLDLRRLYRSAKSKPCAYAPVHMHRLTQELQKVQPIGLQAVLSLLSDRG